MKKAKQIHEISKDGKFYITNESLVDPESIIIKCRPEHLEMLNHGVCALIRDDNFKKLGFNEDTLLAVAEVTGNANDIAKEI